MMSDPFAAQKAELEAYIADCTMALHWGGKRVSQWVPYSDDVIELPARKRDYWFDGLRLTDPETHMVRMIAWVPFVRVRRAEPHRRRVVISEVFGAEIDRLLTEGARRHVLGRVGAAR